MLDDHTRFQANDELALLNAISTTEVAAKKADLFSGLAKEDMVRKFFQNRAETLKGVNDNLRKHLDKLGGS
ncbi:MAG: hypothetical protein VR69_08120 [Peptococcaceae bacterium BRH_c4b]|nr:MAG: hypothetical protein VR69_08120 [Peptococcaceae bacterium BRH_c4b]